MKRINRVPKRLREKGHTGTQMKAFHKKAVLKREKSEKMKLREEKRMQMEIMIRGYYLRHAVEDLWYRMCIKGYEYDDDQTI